MSRILRNFCVIALATGAFALFGFCQDTAAQDSSSSSHARTKATAKPARGDSPLDPGSVTSGVYRNPTFGFTCKIPDGWVLRTDEMNAPNEDPSPNRAAGSNADAQTSSQLNGTGDVLLAAFSRPPQAIGQEVNASIVIAAESQSAYPGMKDAAQYFGPVTEIAKAQGFDVDLEPYEFSVGAKNLVRSDFEKNVGTRVMHQSTLVMLAHGYVVSFTFIAGTENDVEELFQGLSFGAGPRTSH